MLLKDTICKLLRLLRVFTKNFKSIKDIFLDSCVSTYTFECVSVYPCACLCACLCVCVRLCGLSVCLYLCVYVLVCVSVWVYVYTAHIASQVVPVSVSWRQPWEVKRHHLSYDPLWRRFSDLIEPDPESASFLPCFIFMEEWGAADNGWLSHELNTFLNVECGIGTVCRTE